MPELPGYNADEPRQELIYLDAVNLYGAAMSQPLPRDGFRRLTDDERASFDIHSVASDGDRGYALTVDLHVPDHLHNVFADYPLAPEHQQIDESVISPAQREMLASVARDAKVRRGQTYDEPIKPARYCLVLCIRLVYKMCIICVIS